MKARLTFRVWWRNKTSEVVDYHIVTCSVELICCWRAAKKKPLWLSRSFSESRSRQMTKSCSNLLDEKAFMCENKISYKTRVLFSQTQTSLNSFVNYEKCLWVSSSSVYCFCKKWLQRSLWQVQSKIHRDQMSRERYSANLKWVTFARVSLEILGFAWTYLEIFWVQSNVSPKILLVCSNRINFCYIYKILVNQSNNIGSNFFTFIINVRSKLTVSIVYCVMWKSVIPLETGSKEIFISKPLIFDKKIWQED